MNCAEVEQAIIDASHSATSTELSSEASMHIAGCGHCQIFRALQLELDAELSRVFSPPALPAGFRDAVMRQVALEPEQIGAAELAAKKRQYEEEYAACLRRTTMWSLLRLPGSRLLLVKFALAWTAAALVVVALPVCADGLQSDLAGEVSFPAMAVLACIAAAVMACAGLTAIRAGWETAL